MTLIIFTLLTFCFDELGIPRYPLHIFIYFVCVICAYAMASMRKSEDNFETGSLLLPCGSQGSNLGQQAEQQAQSILINLTFRVKLSVLWYHTCFYHIVFQIILKSISLFAIQKGDTDYPWEFFYRF